MISASALELGSGDDFCLSRDSVFINDFGFLGSLWAVMISASTLELGSGDDFWVPRDVVFVNDFCGS